MKKMNKCSCAPEITHRLTMVVNRQKLIRDAAKFAAMRKRLLTQGVELALIPSDPPER